MNISVNPQLMVAFLFATTRCGAWLAFAPPFKGAVPAKVRGAIAMFRPLQSVPNVEIRLHGTILYNSIYRADDQLLVNTHIYGTMANNAPVFHLRKIAGGDMASTYIDSFEHVWDTARPYEGA